MINLDETLVDHNGQRLGVLPNIGEVINKKYKIISQIARGGMGIIYGAEDIKDHKKVVIKMLSLASSSSVVLKRFEREFKICSHLLHPNIVATYDSGFYNSFPYMVMDYIQGKNIDLYVKEHDPAYGKNQTRNYNLCVKLIIQIAYALEYVHKQKIYHRDIKPSNILVCDTGKPILIDFGIAKFSNSQSLALTKNTEVIGTCVYMAPEQAERKNVQFDNRSDIYSLGVVLYELVTERQIFSGSFLKILNQILYTEPIPPSKIKSDVPKELEKIIMHAIEKDREYRYQSAQEFAEALEQYLSHNFSIHSKKYTKQIKQKISEQKRVNKNIVRTKIIYAISIILCIGIGLLIGIFLENNHINNNNNTEIKNATNIATARGSNNITKMNSQTNIDNRGKKIKKNSQTKKNTTKTEKKLSQHNKLHHNAKTTKKNNSQYKTEQHNTKVMTNLEKIIVATEKGDKDAQYLLATMYERGKDVERNPQKALFYYEKAANQEHIDAQYKLATMYNQGIGVEKNQNKACFYYEKAAKQGHIQAQYLLASAYIYGSGVNIDLIKARYWYEKAAIQGHEVSQYMLGFFYEKGSGVKKDLEKARYWYEKAANQGHQKAKEEVRRLSQ